MPLDRMIPDLQASFACEDVRVEASGAHTIGHSCADADPHHCQPSRASGLLKIARHNADDQRGFDPFAQHDQIGGEHWERLSVEKAVQGPSTTGVYIRPTGNHARFIKSTKHSFACSTLETF